MTPHSGFKSTRPPGAGRSDRHEKEHPTDGQEGCTCGLQGDEGSQILGRGEVGRGECAGASSAAQTAEEVVAPDGARWVSGVLRRSSPIISYALGRGKGTVVGFTKSILDDVRKQIAPDDVALKKARERRDAIMSAAKKFRGARDWFASGSIGHGTANCPIHERDKGLDADCGVVLDRRFHVTIGPDSSVGEGPSDVVEEMKKHLLDELKPLYLSVTIETTKRALLIRFYTPLVTGEDPTVDLVVGLERKEKPGLWIPNTKAGRWDASDPQKHTELLTIDPKYLRVTRARAIRLAKAENKKNTFVPLSSFNLEAFGLMFVNDTMNEVEALLALWSMGAKDLENRLTPDPAKVSAAIKVADRDRAVGRLARAASKLESALEHDDEEQLVREALHDLWPEFVAEQPGADTKARLVARIRAQKSLSFGPAGLTSFASSGVEFTKRPRSYGEGGC